MSYEKTWSGDWPARILERVKARGFAFCGGNSSSSEPAFPA